jgi:hypothetical protein
VFAHANPKFRVGTAEHGLRTSLRAPAPVPAPHCTLFVELPTRLLQLPAHRDQALSHIIIDTWLGSPYIYDMFPSAAPLAVNDDQKRHLEVLIRDGNCSQKVALRCRVLLLAHQGVANRSIAQQLNLSRPTVLALRAAFTRDGMGAVTGIRKRKRRAKVLTPELEQRILDTTLDTRPGDGCTHWSVRTLSRHMGISRTIVHRVWQRHDVRPCCPTFRHAHHA